MFRRSVFGIQLLRIVAWTIQHLQGYNKSEASKHRRKDVDNLDACTLDVYLNKILLQPWFDLKRWKAMRRSVTMLAECTAKYATYLKTKCNAIKKHQATLTPVCIAADSESFCLIPKEAWI